jgi:hypothetical protein
LPATLSRTADPRERAAIAAHQAEADLKRATDEYAAAKIAVGEAQTWLRECRAKYQKCPADDGRLADRFTHLYEVRTKLDKLTKTDLASVGDIGSDYLASWLGISPDVARQASVAAYALGVELAIAVCVALGVRREPPAILPPPDEPKSEEPKQIAVTASSWIAAHLAGCAGPVSAEEAYATYVAEWSTRRRRVTGETKFKELFQREAKRRGLVCRQQGRQRLYAVA